jgi:hypothetical protein
VIRRTIEADGALRLSAEGCCFVYRRPAPGVVLIQIQGHDRGQFGQATTNELMGDLNTYAPIELFVDTSEVFAATGSVSDHWGAWFSSNRAALKRVTILTRSKLVHLTIEISKLFSRTGELIRIYLDPVNFERALGRAVPGFRLRTGGEE